MSLVSATVLSRFITFSAFSIQSLSTQHNSCLSSCRSSAAIIFRPLVAFAITLPSKMSRRDDSRRSMQSNHLFSFLITFSIRLPSFSLLSSLYILSTQRLFSISSKSSFSRLLISFYLPNSLFMLPLRIP